MTFPTSSCCPHHVSLLLGICNLRIVDHYWYDQWQLSQANHLMDESLSSPCCCLSIHAWVLPARLFDPWSQYQRFLVCWFQSLPKILSLQFPFLEQTRNNAQYRTISQPLLCNHISIQYQQSNINVHQQPSESTTSHWKKYLSILQHWNWTITNQYQPILIINNHGPGHSYEPSLPTITNRHESWSTMIDHCHC